MEHSSKISPSTSRFFIFFFFIPPHRLLEEGKVAESDKLKDEVEEKQRDRRKELSKRGEEHIPRFFR